MEICIGTVTIRIACCGKQNALAWYIFGVLIQHCKCYKELTVLILVQVIWWIQWKILSERASCSDLSRQTTAMREGTIRALSQIAEHVVTAQVLPKSISRPVKINQPIHHLQAIDTKKLPSKLSGTHTIRENLIVNPKEQFSKSILARPICSLAKCCHGFFMDAWCNIYSNLIGRAKVYEGCEQNVGFRAIQYLNQSFAPW